jgi:hypothetical protein
MYERGRIQEIKNKRFVNFIPDLRFLLIHSFFVEKYYPGLYRRVRRSRDRMVVGFTTTYAISAYFIDFIVKLMFVCLFVCLMAFNATINNI